MSTYVTSPSGIVKSSKPLPVYAFTVHTMLSSLMNEQAVTAAYFQEQGSLIVFKDTEHAVVEAYRTDLVTRIVRVEKLGAK